MRGKAATWEGLTKAFGITPACAGKSWENVIYWDTDRDHPRVCGEKHSPTLSFTPSLGSPPRVRGKGRPATYYGPRTGITPACAGKRPANSRVRPLPRDHPRVCGEKAQPRAGSRRVRGSPPRVRGKAPAARLLLLAAGITPACAGKSPAGNQQPGACGDHPRVCGEKLTTFDSGKLIPGSPPRVRGKGVCVCVCVCGITPACAGKRLKRSHSIGHFSCILCLFHSVLHRASASGGSRAGPCAPPCLPAQNAVPV